MKVDGHILVKDDLSSKRATNTNVDRRSVVHEEKKKKAAERREISQV